MLDERSCASSSNARCWPIQDVPVPRHRCEAIGETPVFMMCRDAFQLGERPAAALGLLSDWLI
jgi:hypothetical protein